MRLWLACAPLAHSNQPEADKSPAKKLAGKSRPDQPSLQNEVRKAKAAAPKPMAKTGTINL